MMAAPTLLVRIAPVVSDTADRGANKPETGGRPDPEQVHYGPFSPFNSERDRALTCGGELCNAVRGGGGGRCLSEVGGASDDDVFGDVEFRVGDGNEENRKFPPVCKARSLSLSLFNPSSCLLEGGGCSLTGHRHAAPVCTSRL